MAFNLNYNILLILVQSQLRQNPRITHNWKRNVGWKSWNAAKAVGQTMWQPYAPTSATGDEGDDEKGTHKDSLIVRRIYILGGDLPRLGTGLEWKFSRLKENLIAFA